MHRHTPYPEHLYVLEGEFTMHTESGAVVLKLCDNFSIPQGSAHAVVSGPPGARGLAVALPSGFAQLIYEAGILAESRTLPPLPRPIWTPLAALRWK